MSSELNKHQELHGHYSLASPALILPVFLKKKLGLFRVLQHHESAILNNCKVSYCVLWSLLRVLTWAESNWLDTPPMWTACDHAERLAFNLRVHVMTIFKRSLSKWCSVQFPSWLTSPLHTRNIEDLTTMLKWKSVITSQNGRQTCIHISILTQNNNQTNDWKS